MEKTLGVFKAKLSTLKVSDQTRSKEFWILAMNFKDHFLSRSCISGSLYYSIVYKKILRKKNVILPSNFNNFTPPQISTTSKSVRNCQEQK